MMEPGPDQAVSSPQVQPGSADGSFPPGLPGGYQAQISRDGTGTEIVPPAPRGQPGNIGFMALWCLVWNGILILMLVMSFRGLHSPHPTPPATFLVLIPMFCIGLGVTAMVLAMAFVRTSWIVGPDSIARRTRVPRIGRDRLRPYPNAQRLEIRHGIWASRRGSTDILRLRTSGGLVKIREAAYSAFYAGLKEQVTDPATGKLDWRAMYRVLLQQQPPPAGPVPVAPEIQALSRFVAEQTGLTVETTEEQIPEPRHASQRM
jgi:hypothetical protein